MLGDLRSASLGTLDKQVKITTVFELHAARGVRNAAPTPRSENLRNLSIDILEPPSTCSDERQLKRLTARGLSQSVMLPGTAAALCERLEG